jgi:hypothetical protein
MQKLCLNLLIKKKRIAQLINGKLGENRYNNTTNNIKSTDQQDNQQALTTYNNHKQTTQRAPPRNEKQLNKTTNSKAEHQSSSRGNFQEMTLFFLLLLRDFSTFLIMSSDAFPAKTQAISMPYPGLTASKLMSKSDNSFAKRASELGANTPISAISSLKDTTSSMDGRETEASKPPLSTWASVWQGPDGGGEGVEDTTTTEGSPHNSLSSGVICSSGANISHMPSLSEAGRGDVQGQQRGEKQP